MMNFVTVFKIRKGVKNQNNFLGTHYHNFFQFVYIISGIGFIKIVEDILKADYGNLYLIPPYTNHEVIGEKDLTTIHISFFCNNNISKKLLNLKSCCWQLDPYESSIIEVMFNESIVNQRLNKELIDVMLYELILRLVQTEQLFAKKGTHNGIFSDNLPGEIQDVLAYIDDNIYSPLSVSLLAGKYGYSDSYFSNCFKKITGITPVQYITARKMKIAKNLLLTSKMNITQISEKLGFSSVHYFSKAFKKFFGVSPKNFFDTAESELVIKIEQKLKYQPKEITPLGK